jgi:hypothetical protein
MYSMMIGRRRKERGLSLLAVALGIAVTTAAISGALLLYGTVHRQAMSSRVVDEATMVMNAVDRAWANRLQFNGLTGTALTGMGLFPDSMIDGGRLKHSAGGNIGVMPVDRGCVGCQDAFRIILEEVETDICRRIVGASFGERTYQVSIGEGGSRVPYVRPYNLSAMQNACVTADGTAGIEYFFQK